MDLQTLADYATCAQNDTQVIHYNCYGSGFHTVHAEVTDEYWHALGEAYDKIAEKQAIYDIPLLNKAGAAERIGVTPLEGTFNRAQAFEAMDTIYTTWVQALTTAFVDYNGQEDAARAIGVANFLQGLIDEWTSQKFFFVHREVARAAPGGKGEPFSPDGMSGAAQNDLLINI